MISTVNIQKKYFGEYLVLYLTLLQIISALLNTYLNYNINT